MLASYCVYRFLYLLDLNSYLFYIESDLIVFYSRLGIVKIKIIELLQLFIENNILYWSQNSLYFFVYTHLYLCLKTFLNSIHVLLKNILIGNTLKYKVIGLGHRGYYSRNIFFFKLGYSHLVFCFLPFFFFFKKKKKKNRFYTIYGVDNIQLNNFFFFLQSLRIPDIYNFNGIFNRIDFFEKKKSKKAALL